MDPQKKTFQASERQTERVQNLRREYRHQMTILRVEDLVFVDEAGVNLGMTRLFGRALSGQRAYGTRPQQRGKNVSLIGAMALRGVVASTAIVGATDGLTFEAFICQRLIPNLCPGACVVMDNASIHQEAFLRPMLEQAQASLHFLSPYSPDFSPIENCWSKVKEFIRSAAPRTYHDLAQAIDTAFQKVSLQDIHNWFTHCCYCLTEYLESV
ncbi:IS630 family transposase [Nostoc sp. 'Lobaria pulmonaria (5183) cyanobiont']|uniref:IS630 family transposase n=1 Tax=Nostoc sp. 'Lobaria pulmonaria (5183) cyanobiont' TaxID=1618022 RepID=UPI001F36DA09|nr:IS630 family transposase [Nostoc sp. 'Lobaria pulmonaria (5183) cyanobiont']